MYRFLVCLLLLAGFHGTATHAQVQKNTQYLGQVWTGFFNQTRLSKHWGLWVDLQLRTKENYFDNLSQSIVRAGFTHYLSDNTKLTLGYAWINHFPGDNHAFVAQPEHRIWQQVQWHTKYPRLRMMQRLRVEEKFRRKVLSPAELGEGYDESWKLRYNFLVSMPLGKKPFAPKTFSLIANDEIHINFGDRIIYNYFDQNRFFIGLGYQINTADQVQFGYMSLFQQLPAGNQYKQVSTARVFYFHHLDFREK